MKKKEQIKNKDSYLLTFFSESGKWDELKEFKKKRIPPPQTK